MAINVMVGCGGTGLQTIMKSTELLLENDYWRHRASALLYYIGIDLSKAELERFEARMKELYRSVGIKDEPRLRTVNLSGNISNLSKVLGPIYRDGYSPGRGEGADLNRLREFIWTDTGAAEGENPFFVAPDHTSLFKGAGQIPPVSFTLAWKGFAEIEQAVQETVQEASANTANLFPEDEEPFETANFFIIAGLAGGTGRGCWPLVGYALRRATEHVAGQHSANPMGIFFDADCYRDVYKKHKDQKFKMRVNALTGWSEMDAWMKLSKYRGSTEFQLPSLTQADDTNSDVIKPTPVEDDQPSANNPVEDVFMLFDSSGTVTFNKSEQAYRMAGAALYALITDASIGWSAVNSTTQKRRSVGAQALAVNSTGIGKWFNYEVREKALLHLSTRDNDTAQDWVRSIQSATGIGGRVSEGVVEAVATPGRTLLGKVAQGIAQRQEVVNIWDSLQVPLGRKADDGDPVEDPDVACETAAALVALDQIAEEVFAKAFVRKDGHGDMQSVADYMISELQRRFDASQQAGTLAVAANSLATSIETYIGALPAADEICWADDDYEEGGVQTPQERLEGFIAYCAVSKSGFLNLYGQAFDDEEVIDIEALYEETMILIHWPKVRELIEANLKPVANKLRHLAQNAEAIDHAAGELAKQVESEQQEKCAELFVTEDEPLPDELFASVNSKSTGDCIHYLPPLQPREEEWFTDENVTFSRDWKKFMDASLFDFSKAPLDKNDEDSLLYEHLERRSRADIRLVHDYIRKNYSLEQVLAQLGPAWAKYLRTIPDEERRQIEVDFQQGLGFSSEMVRRGTEDVLRMPPIHEMLLDAAMGLKKRARPQWLRDHGERTSKVLIPTTMKIGKLTTEYTKDIPADMQAALEIDALVTASAVPKDGGGHSAYNPFVMIAFADDGLGHGEDLGTIRQLERAWQDGTTNEWMKLCESSSGKVYFDKSLVKGKHHEANGYVSPIFVNKTSDGKDPNYLAANRWRPWGLREIQKDELEAMAVAAREKASRALTYALMNDAVGEIKAHTSSLNWHLCMLRFVESKSITAVSQWQFFRRSYEALEGERPETFAACPFEKGTQFGGSLWEAWLALCGDETKAATHPEFLSAILAEDEVFWRDVLPNPNYHRQQLEAARKQFSGMRTESVVSAGDAKVLGFLLDYIKGQLAGLG